MQLNLKVIRDIPYYSTRIILYNIYYLINRLLSGFLIRFIILLAAIATWPIFLNFLLALYSRILCVTSGIFVFGLYLPIIHGCLSIPSAVILSFGFTLRHCLIKSFAKSEILSQ